MNQKVTGNYYLPTLLLINDQPEKLEINSSILASLKQVSMSILEAREILSWIQQYQPDLIILNARLSQIINLQLITTLKLDWLTRNIPILLITTAAQKLQSEKTLDYDACLIAPYSPVELDKTICSLVSVPACNVYGKAV